MSAVARLNKRANQKSSSNSRWFLQGGSTLYLGPSYELPPHQGGASVILVGLYGAFRVRVENEGWRVCRSAVIPPGLVHALDFGGDPIAALYLEPDAGGVSALTPLVSNGTTLSGAVLGNCGEVASLRSFYEQSLSDIEIDTALDDLIGEARVRSKFEGLDPRIQQVVHSMGACSDDITPVARIAEAVGLSSSRFQHLFSVEVGVPYRRYRSWSRMRVAIGEILRGSSCTTAAHVAGYADLAHFTRDCRRTFGGVFTRQNR
jgi:AraC-like DNA-binding protein